jgi:hypothetical protein
LPAFVSSPSTAIVQQRRWRDIDNRDFKIELPSALSIESLMLADGAAVVDPVYAGTLERVRRCERRIALSQDLPS